ncbi:Methionine vitamin-b12 [Mycena indigotica]|uniref:Methionine vitamin-b12 n=1 Tax=Mycena indigotica TaxID=2126181 RepID=A0A8H6W3H1_9AGAR|nr:Methionine vitamin-b12 [Mycena indigotica]KAF7303602.1 Methionine vitamin-b12 [Mycena indigotica]
MQSSTCHLADIKYSIPFRFRHMAAPVRSPLRLRVDHVGSLLRPKPLFEQRTLFEQGKCTHEALKPLEDAAIAHVVALQHELGLATITDGEMRRFIFYDGVFDRLEGIELRSRPMSEFKTYWPDVHGLVSLGFTEFPSCICTSKIQRSRSIFAAEFDALKRLVPPEDVSRLKINMCPPNWFHHFHGSKLTYDKSVYGTDDEYFEDVGIAYRAEIKELYELGCRNIQIDEPSLSFFCQPDVRAALCEDQVDSDELFDTYVKAINLCTKDRPEDLNIDLHVCRGNFRVSIMLRPDFLGLYYSFQGVGFAQASYEHIAQKLFQQVDVDTFYVLNLEYDEDRPGDLHAFRFIPPKKNVVLGIVTTKKSEVIRLRPTLILCTYPWVCPWAL